MSRAVDPAWESRSDWDIYKGLAKTYSELCTGHLGTETDIVALPILHLHLGVQLSRRFLLFAEADGIDLSTDRYVDATAQVRYQISRNWDLGLGYRVIDRIIDTGEIQNETNRDHLDISLGYRF